MHENNQSVSYKWFALGAIVIGTFMAALDTSIVNIAIAKMMAVFNVSLDDIKWVLTAYTLTLGAIIPLTGFLEGKLGSKKLYIYSLAIFTLGSLLCGFAWSNTTMILFRIIQAIGGGMIIPVSISIILQMFPSKNRGMALGVWGIATMAAPAIGPTFGGYIIERLDWRLIFIVNVPIGVIAVILSAILLKEVPHKPAKKLDYIGFISSTVGIVSILYILGKGTIDWRDIKNILFITLGVFSLILFVINELTISEPLLELRLLKRFDFSLSLLSLCFLAAAYMGGVYVVPLFLQNIKGYTALQTGMILLPSAIMTGIMMLISGKLADKISAKIIMFPGLIILALSSYKLSQINLNTSVEMITWLLILRGLGFGLTMMPITHAGMNAVPQNLVPQGSAIQNTVKQIAIAIGINLMTTTITNKTKLNYHRLAEQVTPLKQSTTDFLKVGLLQKQAYTDAIDFALSLCMVFVLIALILTLLMKDKKHTSVSTTDKQL
ncbi:DHA2 family efflux MFS transporter permease subunit [Clostridium algoriphilum]|uniref:DHA2 family efflux MFS transporter permease subunit n=1 Tax=Clostridium algoriphilum TaxID=198347 RepID=UPI001CF28952|nr:DHA2 family efflux MFS transporter permease subunit [Clostridium algoriphilum]MCB2293577.1 DHA2 family efflux MFS transporter permease subunit [Clostridium algoriphilum]